MAPHFNGKSFLAYHGQVSSHLKAVVDQFAAYF